LKNIETAKHVKFFTIYAVKTKMDYSVYKYLELALLKLLLASNNQAYTRLEKMDIITTIKHFLDFRSSVYAISNFTLSVINEFLSAEEIQEGKQNFENKITEDFENEEDAVGLLMDVGIKSTLPIPELENKI
jgi:hypothetical protein